MLDFGWGFSVELLGVGAEVLTEDWLTGRALIVGG